MASPTEPSDDRAGVAWIQPPTGWALVLPTVVVGGAASAYVVVRDGLIASPLYVAPAIAGLGALAAMGRWYGRHGRDRITLDAGHLVVRQAGAPRTIRIEDVGRLDLSFPDGRVSGDPARLVSMRLTSVAGETLPAACALFEHVRPFVDGVAVSIAQRLTRAVRRGETLVFRDRPRLSFEQLFLLAMVVALAPLLPLGIALFVVDRDVIALVSGPLGFLVAVVPALWVGREHLSALRVWRSARRSGGVVVSLLGLRSRREDAPTSTSLARPAYRASDTSTGPWIPWSAVRSIALDHHGLRIETDARPDAIVCSPRTENLFALHRLVEAMCRSEHP